MKNVFFISVGLALVLGARIFKKRQTSLSVVDNLSPKGSNALPIQCLQVVKASTETNNEEWKFYLN